MNKKLKIYSTLFVAAIIILVLNVVHYNPSSWWCSEPTDHMELVDEPEEFVTLDSVAGDDVKVNYKPTFSYQVNVMPNRMVGDKVLISNAVSQKYKVCMQKVELHVPAEAESSTADAYKESRLGTTPYVYAGAVVGVSLIVIVWILCMVIFIICSIRRGEVFVSKVSKYLEISGILLVALYVIQLVGSWLITSYLIDKIHLAGYHVVFVNECNHMYIITGFALMIISQIILMGKELKEEQELTI